MLILFPVYRLRKHGQRKTHLTSFNSNRARIQTNLVESGRVRVQTQGVWLQDDSNPIMPALKQQDLTT